MSDLLLQAIAENMSEFAVESGFVIMKQGERGDAFFVLKSGMSKATVGVKFLFCSNIYMTFGVYAEEKTYSRLQGDS